MSPLKILTTAIMVIGVGVAPVSAASWHPQPAQVQNAQFTMEFGGNDYRRGDHRRDRFERRGNYYFYNGHRGSRERRSGWRHYNGFWFPPSAFSFSIIIDGDRDRHRDRRTVRLSRAHVEWCEDRYRSYRAWDNTFQPYHGPRRQCRSPYFG